MKLSLASFGILAGILVVGAAFAEAGAAGVAGAGGSAGEAGAAGAAGDGGYAGQLSCGNKTCSGWSVGGAISIPACCSGQNQNKCGAFVTDQLASFGLPPGCHEIDQVGKLGCDCPSLPLDTPIGPIELPGCCREAGSTCGVVADLSGYGGPNMGCIDPSVVDGGTANPCSYDTCAVPDAGAAGTAGTGGIGTGGAAAGSSGSAGSAGSTGGSAGSAGSASGGDANEDDGGCGCRAPAGSGPVSPWLAALALLGTIGLRRRNR
jgi:MYXO-CTERM domain-containing protein